MRVNGMPFKARKPITGCKDSKQIFVGKDHRICDKDGQWSDGLNNCLDANTGKQVVVNRKVDGVGNDGSTPTPAGKKSNTSI